MQSAGRLQYKSEVVSSRFSLTPWLPKLWRPIQDSEDEGIPASMYTKQLFCGRLLIIRVLIYPAQLNSLMRPLINHAGPKHRPA